MILFKSFNYKIENSPQINHLYQNLKSIKHVTSHIGKEAMRKKEFDETRFDLLDHWLNWYGGFNSKDIGDVLGLSRQNVSILIRSSRNHDLQEP